MAKEKTADASTATPLAATRFTYVLAFPVEFHGETVNEIDYRRAKGRDVRAAFKARNDGGDMYTSMLVTICEQPEALFDQLDASDYVALVDVCDGFLSPPKKPKEVSKG